MNSSKYYIALGERFNRHYYDDNQVIFKKSVLEETEFIVYDESIEGPDDLLSQAMGYGAYTMLTEDEYKHYSAGNVYPERIKVTSSQGHFIIDPDGDILEKQLTNLDKDSAHYNEIVGFNLKEYKEYYEVTIPPAEIDILDLGYVMSDHTYEPPAQDWREEVKQLREGKDV